MTSHLSQQFHTTDISNSSFLVTGGAGFIGSHIAEYLLKDGAKKVRVLDNMVNGFEKNFSVGYDAVKIVGGLIALIELKSFDENIKDITGSSLFKKIIDRK